VEKKKRQHGVAEKKKMTDDEKQAIGLVESDDVVAREIDAHQDE